MSIPDVRYRRGYSPPEHVKQAIREAHRHSTVRTVLAAVIDDVTIVGAALGVGAASATLPWMVTVALGLLAAVVIARQTRALENLVHEASHFNWHRNRRGLNDALAIALAATPAGVRIGAYRTEHLLHHGRFGTSSDVDRVRYVELDLEGIDRSGPLEFARGICVRLRAYRRSWYRSAVDDPCVAALPFGWAALMIAIPGAAVIGWREAAVAVAVWMAGYLFFLPILRLVAEADEHVYSDSSTVFDATISNTGLWMRILIHPHGDGFHTVHHLWPAIPHHRTGAVHRLLMREDRDGYSRRLRVRTRLLSRPSRAIPATPVATVSS